MKKHITIAFALSFLTGCHNSDNLVDPFEDYNRNIFAFNEKADEYVIGPATVLYRTVIPPPFRMGINNFYSNASEIAYGVNSALQGEWIDCYHSGIRLTVNSIFGFGGIFDMAHDLGLPRKRNDFGKTLYSWGYTHSPYSVSPFFGPSTVRDMFGFCLDKMVLNPLVYLEHPSVKTDFFIINFLETKNNVSEYLKGFSETPYIDDKYIFVRDAFLQYRQYQLDNGKVNWDRFYDNPSENDSSEASLEEPLTSGSTA